METFRRCLANTQAGDSASFGLLRPDPGRPASIQARKQSEVDSNVTSETHGNGVTAAQGRALTSQVHPGLETLPYSARRTVFPADLVDDAVVPPGAQVVVLTYRDIRRAATRGEQKEQ